MRVHLPATRRLDRDGQIKEHLKMPALTFDLGDPADVEPTVIDHKKVTITVTEHADGWQIRAEPKEPKRAPFGQLDPADERAQMIGVFTANVRRCLLEGCKARDCIGHAEKVVKLATRVKTTYS